MKYGVFEDSVFLDGFAACSAACTCRWRREKVEKGMVEVGSDRSEM